MEINAIPLRALLILLILVQSGVARAVGQSRQAPLITVKRRIARQLRLNGQAVKHERA